MPRTFTCHHCGAVTTINPRINRKQKYCSSRACQNARKRASDRRLCPTIKGKALQKQRNKHWREKRPAHVYQKEYRELHPEYVDRNREQQKGRNRKRQKDPASMIVKTDALLLQPLHDGLYAGFKVKNGKIVKTDAFMLQMQLQQGAEASPLINPG